jgi:hypothetical protein
MISEVIDSNTLVIVSLCLFQSQSSIVNVVAVRIYK